MTESITSAYRLPKLTRALSVKIIIDGNDIHIDSVRHSLGEPSAAIHSVDEVAVAKKRK